MTSRRRQDAVPRQQGGSETASARAWAVPVRFGAKPDSGAAVPGDDASSPAPLPILIIDEDRQFLETLAAGLTGDFALTLCFEVTSSLRIARSLAPQLILLAIGDRSPGHEALIPDLLRVSPGAEVVVFCDRHDRQRVVDCLNAGACDYLPKYVQPQYLLDRIATRAEMVSGRQADLGGSSTGRLRNAFAASAPLPSMATIRRLIIDEALLRGRGNCSLAARLLGLTPQAVSAHRRKYTPFPEPT